MPPKKDNSGGDASQLLKGFFDKETKLIAAAFLSCIGTGPDRVSNRKSITSHVAHVDTRMLRTLRGRTL